MKFATTVGINPREPEELGAEARLAEDMGFSMVMIGDNPSVVGEHFAALAVIAANTSRAQVGSFISNTITRHPAVAACGLVTVNILSRGRAYLGLSSGDTAAVNLGLKPGSVAQMEKYIRCVQELLETGESRYQDRPVKVAYRGRGARIFMAAGGPKTLRLAGRIADGVFIETGLLPQVIEDSKRQVAAGAAEAGRSIDDIELWWHARAAIGTNRDDAIDQISTGIAGIGRRLARNGREGKFVPDALWPAIQELEARYDFIRHTETMATGRTRANAHLIGELGLTDYLADRFALVGDVADTRKRLGELRDLGVHNIAVAAVMPDRRRWIETMGREIIPHFT